MTAFLRERSGLRIRGWASSSQYTTAFSEQHFFKLKELATHHQDVTMLEWMIAIVDISFSSVSNPTCFTATAISKLRQIISHFRKLIVDSQVWGTEYTNHNSVWALGQKPLNFWGSREDKQRQTTRVSRTALAKRKSGGEITFPIPPTFDMNFHWYIRRIYIRIKQSGRKARTCGGRVSRYTRPARDLVILILNSTIHASHTIKLTWEARIFRGATESWSNFSSGLRRADESVQQRSLPHFTETSREG